MRFRIIIEETATFQPKVVRTKRPTNSWDSSNATLHGHTTAWEPLLPLDEAIVSRAVFVVASGSDGRTETLLGPAK